MASSRIEPRPRSCRQPGHEGWRPGVRRIIACGLIAWLPSCKTSSVTVIVPPAARLAPAVVWESVAPTPPPGCDVAERIQARADCERGIGFYCEELGAVLDDGQQGPTDAAVRRACADWHHHRACDLRVVGGCVSLVKHLAPGVPAAPIEARILVLLSSSCERGDAGSCVDLGISYEFGRYAVQDEARAVSIYEKACAHVPAEQCLILGLGTPPLAAKALVGAGRLRLEDACSHSQPTACVQLGKLYEAGRQVPKDLAVAAKAYRTACDGGLSAGCTALAIIAFNPAAKVPDVNSAALLNRTCEAGDADACRAYAELPDLAGQDLFMALARACSAGDRNSCRRIADDPTVEPPK